MEYCPLCNNNNTVTQFSARDWLITNEVFPIIHCTNCGHLFTGNAPTGEKLSEYYQSENYTSHTDKATEGALYSTIKQLNLWWKLRLLRRYTPHQTEILDYGCGTGDFLAYCHVHAKMNPTGYDPSDKAISQLRTKYQFSLIENQTEISHRAFDIITLWHVIEHIPNPLSVIQKLVFSLKPEGILVLAMPNHLSFDAKFYKENWAAYDVPRHLHHFSPKRIIDLLTTHGLKLQSISYLPFDPYYISLLSEKNTVSKIPFPLRLIRGFSISLITSVFSVINSSSASSPVLIFRKK